MDEFATSNGGNPTWGVGVVSLPAFVVAPPRRNGGGFDTESSEDKLMVCIAPEERLLAFDGFEVLDSPDDGLRSKGFPATY